jgi:hypothetical protein
MGNTVKERGKRSRKSQVNPQDTGDDDNSNEQSASQTDEWFTNVEHALSEYIQRGTNRDEDDEPEVLLDADGITIPGPTLQSEPGSSNVTLDSVDLDSTDGSANIEPAFEDIFDFKPFKEEVQSSDVLTQFPYQPMLVHNHSMQIVNQPMQFQPLPAINQAIQLPQLLLVQPLNVFSYVLPADDGMTYSDGSARDIYLREPFRLFPGRDPTIPTDELEPLTDSSGQVVNSQFTGQPVYEIKFLPHYLDAYEDTKGDRLEKYYTWGADRLRDILPRIVNARTYYKVVNGVHQYDQRVTIQNAKNSLSMAHQRSRAQSKGGLLQKYFTAKGVFLEYVTTKTSDAEGNVSRSLIPMENLLFGVRVELTIDMDRMVFTDLNGRDHPLFTPDEVPKKASTALLLDHGFRLPTLADLFAKWPRARGYRDSLHPLMARRLQEELQVQIDAENYADAEKQKQFKPHVNPAKHFRAKRKAEDVAANSRKRTKIDDTQVTKVDHNVNSVQKQSITVSRASGNGQATHGAQAQFGVWRLKPQGYIPQRAEPSIHQQFRRVQQLPHLSRDQRFSSQDAHTRTYNTKFGHQTPQEWLLQQPLNPGVGQQSAIQTPLPMTPQHRELPLRLENSVTNANRFSVNAGLDDAVLVPDFTVGSSTANLIIGGSKRRQLCTQEPAAADSPGQTSFDHLFDKNPGEVEEGEENTKLEDFDMDDYVDVDALFE